FGESFAAVGSRVARVAAGLPRFGVTACLPTIITSPIGAYPELLEQLSSTQDADGHAERLGIHLEGPFLNPARRGIHRRDCLRLPALAELDRLLLPGVRIVTLAPEVEGVGDLIRALTGRGVVVSAGHSAASYAEARAAFEAGVRCVTHLFNAMPPL